MNDAVPVWLSRNGEKFGPYEPGVLRQWVAEGKVARGTLAWRTGMAEMSKKFIDMGANVYVEAEAVKASNKVL